MYSIFQLLAAKLNDIVSLDDGDGVVPSGLHHVVQYSPFSAGGAELQNLVKVVSIISSWTFINEFHVKQSQTILWYQ